MEMAFAELLMEGVLHRSLPGPGAEVVHQTGRARSWSLADTGAGGDAAGSR